MIRTNHVRFIEHAFPTKVDHCKPPIPTLISDSEKVDDSSGPSGDTDSDSELEDVYIDDGYPCSSSSSSASSSDIDTDEDDGGDDVSDDGDEESHPSDDEPVIKQALTYTLSRPSRHG